MCLRVTKAISLPRLLHFDGKWSALGHLGTLEIQKSGRRLNVLARRDTISMARTCVPTMAVASESLGWCMLFAGNCRSIGHGHGYFAEHAFRVVLWGLFMGIGWAIST